MPPPDARARFFELLRDSVRDGTLIKLTLGRHRGADTSLRNIFVRPVSLKAGPRLSFVYRHDTRDITKNLAHDEALALLETLAATDFLDAHLFTVTQTAQLSRPEQTGEPARIRIKKSTTPETAATALPARDHVRARERAVGMSEPWLRALGVTNERGQPREAMAAKFRQINKFTELLSHLAGEAGLLAASPNEECGMNNEKWETPRAAADATAPHSSLGGEASPLRVADMGCGKGYLTFATSALFGGRARVEGIEARADLVEFCNRVAGEQGFANLTFVRGTIAGAAPAQLDILIALHACDTATDDAIAKGVAAGARLIVVSPCCHKELRPQLVAPPLLADALRHGIFQERQAEFVTDALRAQLLEWSGYRTKVFEFISTGHTAKNLMIAAVKTHPTERRAPAATDDFAQRIRALAAAYGVHRQSLAAQLGFALA
jgi:SAM-dependent methyltransferase